MEREHHKKFRTKIKNQKKEKFFLKKNINRTEIGTKDESDS